MESELFTGAENRNIKFQAVGDRKLPVFAFFGENKTAPVIFELKNPNEYRYSSFLSFLNDNGFNNTLPGILPGFDELAKKFLAAASEEKNGILAEAEGLYSKLEQKEILVYGESYVTVSILFFLKKILCLISLLQAMKGIISEGLGHLKNEGEKFMNQLRSSTVEEERKDYVVKRINILNSFLLPHSQTIHDLLDASARNDL